VGRVVHFELEAADPARARRFYAGALGWSFRQAGDAPYWLISTGDSQPGIDGGMGLREGPPPADEAPVNAFTCTMSVEDLDATVTKAVELGAEVISARHPIAGVGWIAYLRDTEGNSIGLLQRDPGAA